jgi:hypothetical protein
METTKLKPQKSLKAVPLEESTHKLLCELAKAHGCSIKRFTALMVAYFKATGVDPNEIKGENTAAAIKALDHRLISFIRTQEQKKLNPLLDELSVIARQLSGFLGDYATKEDVGGWAEKILESHNEGSVKQLEELKWLHGQVGEKVENGKKIQYSLRDWMVHISRQQEENNQKALEEKKAKAATLFSAYLKQLEGHRKVSGFYTNHQALDEQYTTLFANL